MAQLAARESHNLEVEGSIPSQGRIFLVFCISLSAHFFWSVNHIFGCYELMAMWFLLRNEVNTLPRGNRNSFLRFLSHVCVIQKMGRRKGFNRWIELNNERTACFSFTKGAKTEHKLCSSSTKTIVPNRPPLVLVWPTLSANTLDIHYKRNRG